jgi:hypothetical protein
MRRNNKMAVQNQNRPSNTVLASTLIAVVLLGLIAVQVANRQAPWAQALASPFFDPKAVKAMGMLATLVVCFGGMAAMFVPHRRTTVFHACGVLLVCAYALGLTIMLF